MTIKQLNWKSANHLQLIEIVFFDKDCPKHLKEAARTELRRKYGKRKVRNPNIRYIEKGGNRG